MSFWFSFQTVGASTAAALPDVVNILRFEGGKKKATDFFLGPDNARLYSSRATILMKLDRLAEALAGAHSQLKKNLKN